VQSKLAGPLVFASILVLALIAADIGWLPAPGRYKVAVLPAGAPYFSFIMVDTWRGKAYPCDLTKCSRYPL
jgi:hypothetical protein